MYQDSQFYVLGLPVLHNTLSFMYWDSQFNLLFL